MILGKLEIYWEPKFEYRFLSIEFNPETIGKCTKELNDLIKERWNIQREFQTEGGIVVELVRGIK